MNTPRDRERSTKLNNMLSKKNLLVYLALLSVWLGFAAWQYSEHQRFDEVMRRSKKNRSQDLTTTFSIVIRSIGRYGIVQRDFMESALDDLSKSADVRGVSLFNSDGELVISSGEPLDLSLAQLSVDKEVWLAESFITITPLQIGEERPPRYRRDGQKSSASQPTTSSQPATRNVASSSTRPLRKPSWMSDEDFAQMMRLEGPHYLALKMNAQVALRAVRRDRLTRTTLVIIAFIAAAGLAAAWFAAARSMNLQLRLARVKETNKILREMNLAAAGLAHETRNPLNLVRGMAQMISKDTTDAVKDRAEKIVNEVDRVSSRLNEFLDYSKPRDAHLAPTNLNLVIRDVANALETDLEDKQVVLKFEGPQDTHVLADEALLRQVIFNLLLNALQAIPEKGNVTIAIVANYNHEIVLEVRDNGPGVPAESHDEIFKPYFTTRSEGTGLGLAIVRQFVTAQQWDIKYTIENGLSVFRISGIQTT